MQHVLVHIDQGLGPIGAWSYGSGALTHFYPESLEPAISARARELMATRDNDMPVAEWMDLIAGSEPTLLDEFQAFEIHDGVSLPAILAEFRRSWTSSD
jgi:3-hydroxy-3-methylglutaryl CoA synthase